MKPPYIAALDIGGTKISAVIAGPEGPLARVMEPTLKTGTERALPEQALAMLEQACKQAGVDLAQAETLGVASCGPFVRRNGLLGLSTPNICGGRAPGNDLPNDWDVVPLEEVLRERFRNVVIENDCVAALSAERIFGAVQNEPDCVYVTWSTGIGFGLCVDGKILHGKHGNAGHAGHMLMSEQDDAVCGCGNRGDLEALISGRNIGTRMQMSSTDLFNAAVEGEEHARAAVHEAARRFGRALYNVTATLDTRVFVIGGSVWLHHGQWLQPLVIEEIRRHLPAVTEDVSIVTAALGAAVADIGALSLVMPSAWLEHWRTHQPWTRL